MLHVASVCTPCCMFRVVGSCCIRLHTTANTDATSPNNVGSCVACSAGVLWVGETLFVFVILLFSYDSGRLGRVEIVTLTVGARAKEGKGEGGGEKILFSLPAGPPPPRSLWLAPSPPLFGKFQHGAFASKLRARRKRLHCRLGAVHVLQVVSTGDLNQRVLILRRVL